MIVVADTGPLLHLHWVGAARWALPSEQGSVVDEVWVEVERHAADALEDARLVRVRAPHERFDDLPPFLDAGERAAPAFALAHAGSLVLCDEMDAREACAALGIQVTGSVGLILQAAREGRIDVTGAVKALEELPGRGGLHASRELIEGAVRAVRGA